MANEAPDSNKAQTVAKQSREMLQRADPTFALDENPDCTGLTHGREKKLALAKLNIEFQLAQDAYAKAWARIAQVNADAKRLSAEFSEQPK